MTDDYSGQRFYHEVIDDELLVIDVPHWELRILNQAAALIWLALLEGRQDEHDLAQILVEQFGVENVRACRDARQVLAEWLAKGWLVRDNSGLFRISDGPRSSAMQRGRMIQPAFVPEMESSTCVYERMADFQGSPVRFSLHACENPLFPDLNKRAAAFLCGLPPARGTASPSEVELFSLAQGVFLRWGERLMETQDPGWALSRMVLWGFHSGYPDRDILATVHAAAICGPQGLLLMPGVSGCGKSTLTAYCVALGWRYCGDDIVGIARENDTATGDVLTVLPFPSAISVKDGGMEVLARFYPELPSLPVVPYADKVARFLPMSPEAIPHSGYTERIPRAFVFPQYRPDARTKLRSLSPGVTLKRLIAVGIATGETLKPDRLDALFMLIKTLPAYELAFSDIENAEKCLKDILSH